MLTKELAHEEDQVEILCLFYWGILILLLLLLLLIKRSKSLSHHVEKKLKTVSRHIDLGTIEGIHKLITVNVTIATSVSRSKRLLERDSLRRKRQ